MMSHLLFMGAIAPDRLIFGDITDNDHRHEFTMLFYSQTPQQCFTQQWSFSNGHAMMIASIRDHNGDRMQNFNMFKYVLLGYS